ncbi:MAG: hypothetical protein ACAI25_10140 [Planctomycetota bacterium]
MATTTNYFEYDLSQRMTKLWSTDTSDATYFVFNQRRQLTTMQRLPVGGDTVRTFAYNGVGERCVVVDGGSPRYWTYDHRKLLVEQQTTGVARRRYRHNKLPTPTNTRLGRTLEVNDAEFGNHNAVTGQSGHHLRIQSGTGFDVKERTIYGEVKDKTDFIQDGCERQAEDAFCSPITTSRDCHLKVNGGACLPDESCDIETGMTGWCVGEACVELESPLGTGVSIGPDMETFVNCGSGLAFEDLEVAPLEGGGGGVDPGAADNRWYNEHIIASAANEALNKLGVPSFAYSGNEQKAIIPAAGVAAAIAMSKTPFVLDTTISSHMSFSAGLGGGWVLKIYSDPGPYAVPVYKIAVVTDTGSVEHFFDAIRYVFIDPVMGTHVNVANAEGYLVGIGKY